MDIIYGSIDILGTTLAALFCVMLVLEKISQNQKYLLLTFVCGLIISFGDALEFFATTQDAALVATKVAYLGKTFIVLFALLFSMGFNQIESSKKIICTVGVLNMVLMSFIMTCEHHNLFYKNIGWRNFPSGRGMLVLEHGVFYYIWLTEFALAIFWYCMHAVLVIRKHPHMQKEAKARMLMIVIAACGPSFFLVASIISPIFQNFDWTTVAIVFMEGFMMISVKKFGLLDTMQLAQERILEDTKDGIIVVDNTKKNILFVNSQARFLFPELTTGRQREVLNAIFSKNENIIEENGRHYELRISEINNNSGYNSVQGYVAWIFDMAFIDQYATEMIRLREEAEHASEAKTNFLAHMSHEIRTPMNAIVGFSELALRVKDTGMIQEYLKNIRISAGNLLQLINEILDISKIEAGKMELVKVDYKVSELIQELQSMLSQPAKAKGLELNFFVDEDVPNDLIGDKAKIQEILLNLMNNSVKYTEKGKIELYISLRERTNHHVRIHIEVQDTGIGIEPENYDAVFRAFEQFDTKVNYGKEGTGLGLAIVKRIVEMMQGSINFESSYGKGTTFYLDIRQKIGNPEEALKEQTAQNEAIAAPVEEEPRSGHVLVVDDNELNCDVAQGILECLDMQVTVSNSGADCLEKLKYMDELEFVFMDHMMPEMDGVETLHRIREMGGKFSTIPVVLLTANAVSGVREQMIKEGFDEFLSKPIDVDELKRILIQFLGKK